MNRRALIRKAASFPKGSEERREILAALKTSAAPRIDKRKYLKGMGIHCPFCGWEASPMSSHPVSGDEVYQPIKCKNCEAQWDDIYKMDDIEVTRGPQVAADKLKHPAEPGTPLAKK